jgi:hypothetical protein
MAKGQKRSTREKKKPKADKKAATPSSSAFASSMGEHKPGQGSAKKSG